MEFKTQLTAGLLADGGTWLEHWMQIPIPAPKRYDMPPRGAAGTAILTFMWGAEELVRVAALRARLDAGDMTPADFNAAISDVVWTELGSDKRLEAAAALPERYRKLGDYVLCGRYLIRNMYQRARPATATTTWKRPFDAAEEDEDGPIGGVLDWLGFSPTFAWPIVVFGIGAVAAAAWYGSKRAEFGVAIEAESAASMARAWRDMKIASIQAAAGQTVEVPEWVSRAADIERAQSSPWLIGGAGVAAGAAAVGGAAWAMTRRRSNPSSPTRRTRKCVGRDVEVAKYASGFRAWTLDGGKRGRSISVTGAKSFDEAFRLACADIRKRRHKNPHPKKRTKKRTTKRVTKKRNPAKRTKKRATKKRTTKRVTKKRNPAKRTKKRATKKRATKKRAKKRTTTGGKDAYLRSRRAKGRSAAQAEADWKGRQRMRGASGKRMRAAAKRARKKAA